MIFTLLAAVFLVNSKDHPDQYDPLFGLEVLVWMMFIIVIGEAVMLLLMFLHPVYPFHVWRG